MRFRKISVTKFRMREADTASAAERIHHQHSQLRLAGHSKAMALMTSGHRISQKKPFRFYGPTANKLVCSAATLSLTAAWHVSRTMRTDQVSL